MAAASGPNLFNTTYPQRFVAPADGQTGGTVIVADWQEANLFNPYYFNQVTEADVNTTTEGGWSTSTDDFKYVPDQAVSIPTTDNGGVVANADGTVDHHLEAARRPDVVGRHAPHLRRLHVHQRLGHRPGEHGHLRPASRDT